jgi:putative ABC transport system permease protein
MSRLAVDAWRDLRAHAGKAAMTALSLFIAVLALVGVTVEGAVSRASVIARDEQQSGRAATMMAYVTTPDLPSSALDVLRLALDHRITAQLGGSWAGIVDLQSSIEARPDHQGSQPIAPHTFLVEGDLAGVRRTPIRSGRPLRPTDATYPGLAMVNAAAAETFGDVGSVLALAPRDHGTHPYRFTIIGVIDDGYSAPSVYLQRSTWSEFDPTFAGAGAIEFLAHAPGVEATAISDAMATAFAESGVEPEDAIARYDGAEAFDFSQRAVTRAFLVATYITLVVAIVGMTNIGLSSVRERTQEYAVRRACGFTRADVVGLVVMVNTLIGLLASLAALVIAFLVTRGVLPGLHVDPLVGRPSFPWRAGLVAIGAGVSAAVCGALAPAAAVSRVDVATLLR